MSPNHLSEDKQIETHLPGSAVSTHLEPEAGQPANPPQAALHALHQQLGNRAVQRLLNQPCDDCPADPAANVQTRVSRTIAQRSGDGSFALDDDTEARINGARGGGQALDGAVQAKMGEATGHNFSGVRVHTSPEANDLSHQLGATAFTTGSDVFFRDGAYNPGSSSGQELLAHELTHVVQQSSGAVGEGGGRMTVNAPGDSFEQEADAVAKSVMTNASAATSEAGLQRRREEDGADIQRQEMTPEDDDEQGLIQEQAAEEDDLEELSA